MNPPACRAVAPPALPTQVPECAPVPPPLMHSILALPGCRREAVAFLKRIKEIVEDPRRLLLDV